MPHFENIPLVQVEVTVVCSGDPLTGFDRLNAIRQELTDLLPGVQIAVPTASLGQPHVAFAVGSQYALRLFNDDLNVDLLVYSNALQARWIKGNPTQGYVRYGMIRRIVERALASIQAEASLANISYKSLQPFEGTNTWDWLKNDWIAPRIEGDRITHELMLSYQVNDGVDFKLTAQNTNVGMLISTDGGRKTSGQTGLVTLDIIHETMLEEFVGMVTPSYKEKWGHVA